ncbi:hypothetical protein B0I37DRAFT_367590 [Chaetomium sp. MPI-CAGE-AT-0009]|nr:hypothetical protein B0I37DRAFT_367590 [Chaetomium sp. MPI-CAGE-AT-0009]
MPRAPATAPRISVLDGCRRRSHPRDEAGPGSTPKTDWHDVTASGKSLAVATKSQSLVLKGLVCASGYGSVIVGEPASIQVWCAWMAWRLEEVSTLS